MEYRGNGVKDTTDLFNIRMICFLHKLSFINVRVFPKA